ncbi:hypothetical protein [Leptolyngbya sp. GGD]|uniref:hypothetical protein n=1 Tax=Leptolyngbya sp. GGD TaxID=2997907 RepID=UPI00227AB5A5|nr:hypothetical protein [Leptolyngbya sp. GGD]MCY6489591.1 hypothetical protein [Leptolyngbya sp. GGD]
MADKAGRRNMRYVLLIGLASAGFLLSAPFAGASTRSNAPIEDATRDYWREAHRLTQDQVRLLDRVERSAATPEATRLKTIGGQILLHISAVERFLKSNYPKPDFLCSPPSELGEVAGTDGASLEQVQVYCALHQSTHDFTTMRSQVDRQAKLMSAPVVTAKVTQPLNPRTMKTGLSPSAPSPSTGSVTTKGEVLSLVHSSRQRLAQVQPAFPEALQFSIVPSPANFSPQSADSRSR